MDQHPYFQLIAACLTAATLAVVVCLSIAAWLISEKARTAAVDRRIARTGEKETARFRAQSEAFLAQAADHGPLDGEGRWPL